MKRKPGKSGFTKHRRRHEPAIGEPLIGLLEMETDNGALELAMKLSWP